MTTPHLSFNQVVGRDRYPEFRGFLYGKDAEHQEYVVTVDRPGDWPGVRRTALVRIPVDEMTVPPAEPEKATFRQRR
jgi:hypothetical protein